MVLLLIMSFALLGALWLRFDTLAARVGQTHDQLRAYDDLFAEMQNLKRRVAMLEKPVPVLSAEELLR